MWLGILSKFSLGNVKILIGIFKIVIRYCSPLELGVIRNNNCFIQVSFVNILTTYHSDLFSKFWSDDSLWGYTAQIWLSSIPIVFLGVKDSRKNEKGRQRSWRPNKGQRVNKFKFHDFFISTGSFGVLCWQNWMILSF